MDETQEYIVPGNLANAIAQYLAERPYKEVAGLLAALSQVLPTKASALEASKPDKPLK